MGHVQLLVLTATGRYLQTRATEDPEWPYLVVAKGLKPPQAFNLHQSPVFPKAPPIPLSTWDDLLALEQPRANVGFAQRQMVAKMNDPYPIATGPTLTPAVKVKIGHLQKQEMLRVARNKASREDGGQSAQRRVYLILGTAIGFFCLLLGFIAIERVWLS